MKGYMIIAQIKPVTNKGRQQPMYDIHRNLSAIPARNVILEAITYHTPYVGVGRRG